MNILKVMKLRVSLSKALPEEMNEGLTCKIEGRNGENEMLLYYTNTPSVLPKMYLTAIISMLSNINADWQIERKDEDDGRVYLRIKDYVA